MEASTDKLRSVLDTVDAENLTQATVRWQAYRTIHRIR